MALGSFSARADWDVQCAVQAQKVAAKEGIPAGLLEAIATIETGRWSTEKQASFAWPYTVMAEGKGRYLPTKEAAIAEVRKLKAKGVRNIDVGCMQINLHYHPDAFDSLEEAFDPRANIAYAAEFLKDLFDNSGSWHKAIAHYHSMTPEFGDRYRQKVLAVWHNKTPANNPKALAAQLAAIEKERVKFAIQREQMLQKLAVDRQEAKYAADQWRMRRMQEYENRRIAKKAS